MLVDLRPKRLTGKVAEVALGRAHITCNKNGIPFDPEKPMVTSGVRLGTPAGTTRGFGVAEFRQVGDMIAEVLDVLSQKGVDEDDAGRSRVREKVKALVARFPIYQDGGRRRRHALSELREPRYAGQGLRGRPRIRPRSAAAACASPAISASPPSSACSCAN